MQYFQFCSFNRGLLGNLWGLHAYGFRHHGRQGKWSDHGFPLGRPRLFSHPVIAPLIILKLKNWECCLLDLPEALA